MEDAYPDLLDSKQPQVTTAECEKHIDTIIRVYNWKDCQAELFSDLDSVSSGQGGGLNDEQPGDVAGVGVVILGCQAGGSLLHHFCPEPCGPEVCHQGHALLQQASPSLGTHQHICLQCMLIRSSPGRVTF